jgi:calcineurin-like phosphoesterase family protein
MEYVISDFHFGHEKIRKLTRLGFQTNEEMHSAIISGWNKTIINNDIKVYVLGDIGEKESIEEILPKLRGRKVLLMGNHDKLSKSFYLKYFEEVLDAPLFWSKRIVLSHHPIPVEPGVINVHGHTHDISLASSQHFNVCVERVDYTPVKMSFFEDIIARIPAPNKRFLYEWYKDIQKPLNARADLVLNEEGLIDVELTLKKRSAPKEDPNEIK